MQAEDGIRDLVRSRGLGDVYKRQAQGDVAKAGFGGPGIEANIHVEIVRGKFVWFVHHLSLIHI